ncbi:MAG: AraC family transcriptional regulator [Flavobacteriaceae bacterium]|nr:AraC family transcriptional regulator [Flavobacteriaceae bacterium]
MSFILFAQIIISVFIIFALYTSKDDIKFNSDKILLFYIILLMIRFSVILITKNLDLFLKLPYTMFVTQSTYFLDAVFIYFYVKILKGERIISWKSFFLLIPFIVFTAMSINVAMSVNNDVLTQGIIDLHETIIVRERNLTDKIYVGLVILFNTSLYLYSLYIFKYDVKLYNQKIEFKSDLTYQWQNRFIHAWFYLFLLPFIFERVSLIMNMPYKYLSETIFLSSTLLLTFIFGLKKIKIKYEQVKYSNEGFTIKKLIKKEEKYGALKIDDKTIQNYKSQIENLIQDENLILNSELNLQIFSGKLLKKPYIISQVINTIYNKSFNDFINEHRIKYAKQLLTNNPDYKIIHIALDCGFNSKTTFNRQFKKLVGMTPTEYKESRNL